MKVTRCQLLGAAFAVMAMVDLEAQVPIEGEGAASVDLIGHHWIGSLEGTTEGYGGNNKTVAPHTSAYVLNGSAVTLTAPWTAYTAVGEGTDVRLFRNGQLLGTIPYKKDTSGDFFLGRHWWGDGAKAP